MKPNIELFVEVQRITPTLPEDDITPAAFERFADANGQAEFGRRPLRIEPRKPFYAAVTARRGRH